MHNKRSGHDRHDIVNLIHKLTGIPNGSFLSILRCDRTKNEAEEFVLSRQEIAGRVFAAAAFIWPAADRMYEMVCAIAPQVSAFRG
jgi:hypothetical protein